MDLIHPLVQQYAEEYSSPEEDLLKEVANWTREHHSESIMLSGHLQGKFLEMISCLLKPERVLEIGTFTGYSALCLARGLAPNGQLHTIEIREEDAAVSRAYFNRSKYSSQIILHTGNALKLVPELKETWDFVFIDADKPSYIQYFNLVLPNVRKNGLILADNIFFHGQVLDDESKGKSAKGIRDFNEYIRQRKDIEKLILTLRDGLFLIRKL